jgi:hypothetical protein
VEGTQLAAQSVQQVDSNRGASSASITIAGGGLPHHVPLKRNSIAAAVVDAPGVRTDAQSMGVVHTADAIPSVGDVVLLMVQTKQPSSPAHDSVGRIMTRQKPLGIFLPCM